LFGFDISYADESLHISKGALKYGGNIVVVTGIALKIADYDQQLYIRLSIGKRRETDDYIMCPIEVRTGRDRPTIANEIELGRFNLNPGAILRCKYDSFADMRTRENTLDITQVPYAGIESPTLHPAVIQEYARSLLKFSADPNDAAFAMICLNGGAVQKNVIQWHIAKKSNKPYAELSISGLYDKLLEMLPESDRRGRAVKPRFTGPKIS
jgi:hypothetical protein